MRCWRASTERASPQPTRSSPRTRAGACAALAIAAALLAAGAARAAPEPPIDIRFGRHPGYWRIALEWAEPAPAEITTDARRARIVVAPFTGDAAAAARAARRLDAVVRHARVEGDALQLWLRDGVVAEPLAGLDPRILAVDFRPPPTVTAAPAPDAAIVPRRRPPPNAPPSPRAIEPFPVATAPAPGAGTSAVTADTAEDDRPDTSSPAPPASSAAAGMLPPLAEAAAPPAPTPATDGSPSARVAVPPPPATEPAPTATAAATALPLRPVPMPPPAATAAVERPATIDLVGPLTPPSTRANAAGDGEGQAAGAPDAEPAAVGIHAGGGALAFTFPRPVDAAAWRRGGEVWLAFALDPAEVAPPTTSAPGVERIPHADALVWRITVPADAPRRLEADGRTWPPAPPAPRRAAGPAAAATAADAAAADAAAAFAVVDPWLGETWHVLPAGADGDATAVPRRDGARSWLPTLHGRRFRDLSEAAAVEPGPGRADAGGLDPGLPRPELGPLIGLAGPTLPSDAAVDRRRALEAALFADPVPARRLALARFLLGRAEPFDAVAVLDAAETGQDDAAAARRRALGAVAATLAGRTERARALLPPATPGAAGELWLWHGMLAAAGEDWAQAGEAFARSGQAWRGYPLPLRRRVAAHAAEAALRLDAPQVALTVLHQVESDAFERPIVGALTLLDARARAALGDRPAALERLRRLERADIAPPLRRRARVVRVRLDHGAGELDAAAAREILEADAVDWTGKADAAPFWRLLAELRAATGDARGAFVAWRRAGLDALGEPQRAVIDALIAGEPPFTDSLDDAVVVLERHLDGLEAGPARSDPLRRLAERVAAETDALHVADRLYRRALAEPLPHAVTVELRLALAELGLERQLPERALAALRPLDDAVDPRVAALRATARARREGREGAAAVREPTPATAAEPGAPTAPGDGLAATLEAVEETLAETRRLLEEETAAPADDDGS